MLAHKKKALLGLALMELAKKREAAIVDRAVSHLTDFSIVRCFVVTHESSDEDEPGLLPCSVRPPYVVHSGKELVTFITVHYQVLCDFRIRRVEVFHDGRPWTIHLFGGRPPLATPKPIATRQNERSLDLELLKRAKRREAAAVDHAVARFAPDQSLAYCRAEFTFGGLQRRGGGHEPCHSGAEYVEHLVRNYSIKSDFRVNYLWPRGATTPVLVWGGVALPLASSN